MDHHSAVGATKAKAEPKPEGKLASVLGKKERQFGAMKALNIFKRVHRESINDIHNKLMSDDENLRVFMSQKERNESMKQAFNFSMKNKLANLGFEVAGLGLPLAHQLTEKDADDEG